MGRPRFFGLPSLLSLSFLGVFLCVRGEAQGPGSIPGPAGGIGGITGVENLNTTSIAVDVRGEDGAKLNSLAIVNLSNLFGQLVRSQTSFGSQTVFQVGPGAYTVDVEVFGYEKTQVRTEVSSASPHRVVVVKLKPDTANGLNSGTSAHIALSPKTQKEMVKAIDRIQANKFDEAIQHLQTARQFTPNHPDIPYLLGLVYEKKNDSASARKYWDAALQMDPGHTSSLLACGEMLLSHGEVDAARSYLNKAAEVAPNSWRAHSLLAKVLLRQGLYPEAVTHAQRAIQLDKERASSALLVLGQALAAEHQNEQALAALKEYLAAKPAGTAAEAVKQLIEKIKAVPNIEGVGHGVSDQNSSLAVEIFDVPLKADELHWMPASIDDATAPTEPGVSCSLPDVIDKASARVTELPALVDRYAATEVLRDEEVNNSGYAERVDNLSFNYLASIREIKSKFGNFLDVQEYRNGSTGNDMFPDKMASTGLPSVVLIFHPWIISDFDMNCEGLSRAGTGFAWQIRFSQRKDRESRIRQYRMGGHVYPVALKGRAWIDADTFEIVRLETDLREPRPDLRLAAEHLVLEYAPVHFKSRKETLYLPSSADYYAVFRGHRLHRQHAFTDYVLFSIDDKQQLGKPSS
jgi:tetratricopeptide (TPR) repeat protein